MNGTNGWTKDEVNAKVAEVRAAVDRLRAMNDVVTFQINDCPLGMVADMMAEDVAADEKSATDGYRDLCWLQSQVDAVFLALAKAKATMLAIKEEVPIG
jgi:hypothetical protein